MQIPNLNAEVLHHVIVLCIEFRAQIGLSFHLCIISSYAHNFFQLECDVIDEFKFNFV
jgi:hypothetical protein